MSSNVIWAAHRFRKSAPLATGTDPAIAAAQEILGPIILDGAPVLDVSSKGSKEKQNKMATNRPTTVRRVKEYLGPDKEIQPQDLDMYEAQGHWIVEPKIDGMWAMLLVGSPKDGVPHVLKSRDARTPTITGTNLGDLHQIELPLEPGTIIVGELEAATQHAKLTVEQQGYRRLHLFDIVRIGEKQDMTDLKWGERRAVLASLHDAIEEQDDEAAALRFPMLPFVSKDFRAFYDHVVARGEEGIVLKHTQSSYRTARSDGKTDAWLRCKRWITEDYVLMGTEMTPGGKYTAPKPTGVWGLHDAQGNLQRVFAAPAKPEELHLNPTNHGVLVAEFMGWGKMKSGALRHAQFVRVRTDKMPQDCKL
jgi:ATP-dependent DNA ligase